jgi:carbonic anhydrase
MPVLRTICVLAGGAVLAAAGLADDKDARAGPAWSYAGAAGPQAWGRLDPAWAACARGEQQSPVDLAAAVPAGVAPPQIAWRSADAAEVVNTGRTIQVNLENAGGIRIGDAEYVLAQFHFHHPSEHALEGRRSPLEAHFVHAGPNGTSAVIAVLFEEGAASAALQPLWAAAPAEPGSSPALAPVDPAAFLPTATTAFHYAGSLTTPPCTENVVWTVFAAPVGASAAQIEAFAAIFPDNARPLQPRRRRFVLITE